MMASSKAADKTDCVVKYYAEWNNSVDSTGASGGADY